jgi:pimeloyl-ACP methyl ester carboxylesterase
MEAALWRLGRLALVALVLLGEGCTLWRLHEDLARMETFGLLGGTVSRPRADEAPIIVALCRNDAPEVVDTFVLDRPGAYFFLAPAGAYRVAAFVDRDRDFIYEPGEPAAWHGADVAVAGGHRVGHVDLRIVEPGVRLDVPISARGLGRRATPELPTIHLGEIVTFDDPRFTDANAKRGLWQPVEFVFEVGAGLYLLEPFDPEKTPVLFVHGAGGHPGNWRYLVEHLDRTRFQPWLVHYPSGMDLQIIARGIARWTTAFATRYGVRRLIVVAHSMGGLVSRAAINTLAVNGDGDLLALFVTLSTPWNGHPGAARGVETSPVVMPAWPDLVPDSPFLLGLYETPLPAGCPYHLLFSFNGHSLLIREPNDGVVPVASELAMRAQNAAARIYGFDESHVGILNSAEVSRTVNALLADAAR